MSTSAASATLRPRSRACWRREGASRLLRLPLARHPLRRSDLSGPHLGGHFIACLGCRLAQFSKPRGRRQIEPHVRLHIVLRHASAEGVQCTEVALC